MDIMDMPQFPHIVPQCYANMYLPLYMFYTMLVFSYFQQL